MIVHYESGSSMRVDVRDDSGRFLPTSRIVLRVQDARAQILSKFGTEAGELLVRPEVWEYLRGGIKEYTPTRHTHWGRHVFAGLAISCAQNLDVDMVVV